jgi:hypothetical protein
MSHISERMEVQLRLSGLFPLAFGGGKLSLLDAVALVRSSVRNKFV